MSAKNNKFMSVLFYVVLFSVSLFFLFRFLDIGIEEAVLIIPAIDIVIIVLRKMIKKHGVNTLKILFNRKSLSLVFMAVPVFISFMTFTVEVEKKILWIFPQTETVSFSISPSFISTLTAIILYLSVVVRYRLKLFSDVYETLIICLNILFCASFLEMFFPKEIWNIPFINISSQSFLLGAVILSWIGMRAIAGFVWIFLFIIAATRIAGLNAAMGHLGAAYILSAFISIGLQLKDSVRMIYSFKNDFIGVTRHVGGDIDSSINTIRSSVGNTPKIKKQ
jgi:hypothetical protein